MVWRKKKANRNGDRLSNGKPLKWSSIPKKGIKRSELAGGKQTKLRDYVGGSVGVTRALAVMKVNKIEKRKEETKKEKVSHTFSVASQLEFC